MIELLIALAIAMFVVAALYGLFIMQSRQFIYQDLQMEMHQNLRFATDTIARSVRMAGFNTNGEPTGWGGITGPDDAINPLPVVISHDDWNGEGHDAITLVYGDPSLVVSTTMLSIEQCETTGLSVLSDLSDYSDKLSEYEAGELLLCMDYASIMGMESYIWVINSIDGSTYSNQTRFNVASNTGYSDYDAVCPSGENLTPIMSCSKAQVLTFYIDDVDDGVGPGSPSKPVLMLDMDLGYPEADDVPVVENVEDMQLSYCVDNGTDDTDCTDSSNWKDSIDMTDGDVPWMVRLSLVVRSAKEDPEERHTGTTYTLENHSSSGASDGYFRELLTTEITVRNLRTQSVL